MPRNVICLNIGSSQLTLAEFELLKPDGIQLLNYAIKPLGLEPGDDTDPSAYIVTTIREILREKNIKPGMALVSISGKDIFPRFVKLPPVANDKVDQIVFYEAQQNVPFPIDEVVWDYQLVENDDGSHSCMLVAVKTEIVKRISDAVEASGLEPEIVDVAPMCLYNLVRFNHDQSGCVLVMDIGARSTNLVFIESQKAFSRSIPVAGHTITNELMKEFDVEFKDAEELKFAHAFVAFSGAVETGDSQSVNRVAKTVRTVMTRLHSEVSRSISFYRSQQNGSKPSLILLTGGSCIIPETDTFLREKLGMRVEYMNPFQTIAVADHISTDDVAANMHLMGEVAGLALRKAYSCPMEINLMPPELVAKKTFRNRLPFFGAAAAAIIIALTCWWAYHWRTRHLEERNVADLRSRIAGFDSIQSEINDIKVADELIHLKADRLLTLVELKTQWIGMIRSVRVSLLDGMWITSIHPIKPERMAEITHIEIKGMGFVDKVTDAQAVGEFAEALAKIDHFSDDVEVKMVGNKNEFALGFTIQAELKEPLTF